MSDRAGRIEIESLAEFRDRVESLLAGPDPAGPASVSPTLYPAGQAPDLLVFVGERHVGKLRAVRAQLPERCFLLFFHLPGMESAGDAWRSAFHGRTLACPLAPEAACREKLAFLLARLPRRQVRLVLDPAVEGRLGDWPRELKETILFTLDNCQQDRTRGLIRLRCSILNLPAIIANRGLRLRPVPVGTDALVCGAGPSLESQLDLIRDAKGRFLLLAVGHAVPVLTRAGIRPDVVVEVDSQADRNWPAEVRPDCLLAAAAEVAPAVAARFRRVLWFAGSSPSFAAGLAAWGLRLPDLAMARTVTASAVDLAIRFGCRRVALVGQDLCLGPDGQLHAGARDVEEVEDLFDLPGNDGGTVRATRDLAGLREALQAFLRAVNRAFAGRSPAPLLVNCTQGGARLEEIGRLDLAAFLGGLEPGVRPLELVESVPVPDLSSAVVAGTARDLERMALLAAETAAAAGCLRECLATGGDAAVRSRAKTDLQAALAREVSFGATEARAAWIQPLMSFGNAIGAELAALSGSAEPDGELARVRQRALLLEDVSRDLAADLAAVAEVLARGGVLQEAPVPRVPHAFVSFRRLAMRCLASANPELADWMARQPFPAEAPPDRFQARWFNQMAPYAKVRAPGGDWLALTRAGDVSDQARSDVARWLGSEPFESDRQAVLFVAAGTWLHVLEFARRFPAARLAVLEPWLDWFLALCDHGCVVHALPAQALVVAADDRLPGWRPLLAARLREWREAEFTLRLFPHPRAGGLPEVAAWTREFAPRVS
jgi:hypothetical protein